MIRWVDSIFISIPYPHDYADSNLLPSFIPASLPGRMTYARFTLIFRRCSSCDAELLFEATSVHHLESKAPDDTSHMGITVYEELL